MASVLLPQATESKAYSSQCRPCKKHTTAKVEIMAKNQLKDPYLATIADQLTSEHATSTFKLNEIGVNMISKALYHLMDKRKDMLGSLFQ